jgi:peroxiredoxin
MNKTFPYQKLTTIDGTQIDFHHGSGLVHLQLRRFSGCPICNLHLRNLSLNLPKLNLIGVKEVIVFHSPEDVIQENIRDVDWTNGFNFIADPKREIYKEMGAESSGWKYLFRMRASTFLIGLKSLPRLLKTKRQGAEGVLTQRPMDLLIDSSSGLIVDSYYGIDSNDQWSYQEIESKAQAYLADQDRTPNP